MSEVEPVTLERMLTPAEAARMIGVSVNTLAWWRRQRRGPRFRRVGKHARYAPSDIKTYVDSVTVETVDSEALTKTQRPMGGPLSKLG